MKKYSYLIGVFVLTTGVFWQYSHHDSSVSIPAQTAAVKTSLVATSTEQKNPATNSVRPTTHSQAAIAPSRVVQQATTSAHEQHSSYGIPILQRGSVLEAMRVFASSSPSFAFSGRDYPALGYFVTSINGVPAGNGKNWMLYVNDVLSPKGASSEVVSPGDTVEWRLEDNY